MALNGKEHLRVKTVINYESLDQINTFQYLGCDVSYTQSNDLEEKLQRFQLLIGSIKCRQLEKNRKKTFLKFNNGHSNFDIRIRDLDINNKPNEVEIETFFARLNFFNSFRYRNFKQKGAQRCKTRIYFLKKCKGYF